MDDVAVVEVPHALCVCVCMRACVRVCASACVCLYPLGKNGVESMYVSRFFWNGLEGCRFYVESRNTTIYLVGMPNTEQAVYLLCASTVNTFDERCLLNSFITGIVECTVLDLNQGVKTQ